jgi:hypothetical protein
MLLFLQRISRDLAILGILRPGTLASESSFFCSLYNFFYFVQRIIAYIKDRSGAVSAGRAKLSLGGKDFSHKKTSSNGGRMSI